MKSNVIRSGMCRRKTGRLHILCLLLLAAGTGAWAQTIDINNPGSGSGYTWNSPTQTLTITGNNGTYTINGTGAPTANRIVVSSGVAADITLNNVNINVSATTNACAFDMTEATVNLTLTGDNILKSGENKAGLQAPLEATPTALTIAGTGSLTATGGNFGAGIGGGTHGSGGSITISGGTVTATGGYQGAGIGGGRLGPGGSISITGGTVTATGGSSSAGIGGGLYSQGGNITITGGTVTATSSESAAGIGGGYAAHSGNITISGGTITATGSNSGAGIGGGPTRSGITITISGGKITATGGAGTNNGGAGIGGGGGVRDGESGSGGTIIISGGTIIATGKDGAEDIGKGKGNNSNNSGTLTITGGSINAANIGAIPTNGNSVTVYRNTLTAGGSANANAAVTAGYINGIPCAETPNAANGIYGIKDVVTDGSGKVYFYLPVSANNGATVENVALTAGNNNYTGNFARTTSGATATLNPIDLLVTSSDKNTADASVYTFAGNVHTIKQAGTYTITGTTTVEQIVVNSGGTKNITLDGVNIDVSATSDACAFDMTGATVNLTLEGDNILKSGIRKAGLQVPSGATLIIDGTGSLETTGGNSGAGIGGSGGDGGNITINGGTITANGGGGATYESGGAGIGGAGALIADGNGYGGGNITVNGGTVTATGGIAISGYSGAGIGGGAASNTGGSGGSGGTVRITGGTIKATGGSGSADIGKGRGNNAGSGTLEITGGSIYATNGNVSATPTNDGGSGNVYLNTLTVGSNANANALITAGNIGSAACIDGAPTPPVYGIHDVVTDGDGKVYFWLPASGSNEVVELKANDTDYGKSYTRGNNNNAPVLTTPKYGITLSPTGTQTFTAATYGYGAQTAKIITVTNTGYMATGVLTVQLTGTNAGDFTLSTAATPISDIAAGSNTTFTVVPNTGLDADTHTATVEVSGTNVSTQTFDVSFEVTPKEVTVTWDNLTCTYNGSQQCPTASVTATDGLVGADVLTVTVTGGQTAAGGPYTATATALDGADKDNYTLPSTLPTTAFSIGQKTVTISGVTIAPKTYDGTTAATVTDVSFSGLVETLTKDVDYSVSGAFNSASAGSGNKTVQATVTLLSTTKAGNYNLTNGTGYSLTGQSIGKKNIIVTGGTITPKIYDGTASATVTELIFGGLENSETLAIGTDYAVTSAAFDNAGVGSNKTVRMNVALVSNPTTDNYNLTNGINYDLTGQRIDEFLLDLEALEDLGVTVDLTKTPVEVTVPDNITGLGDITVKYNGRTRIPDEPGTYEVTVDITPGANYAGATGLVIGTVTIPEPDEPEPAQREVILPSMPGFTTDPPAGSYFISSGDDFVFTITPAATQALLTPVIAIGRTANDGDDGVEITPNGDGTYTVRIRQVRQPLTVIIDFTTATAPVDGTRVWSHAGTLHITAATAAEARIYSVSGGLAKSIPVAAGETVSAPLPAGFYVVVLGGKPYKVFVE